MSLVLFKPLKSYAWVSFKPFTRTPNPADIQTIPTKMCIIVLPVPPLPPR